MEGIEGVIGERTGEHIKGATQKGLKYLRGSYKNIGGGDPRDLLRGDL